MINPVKIAREFLKEHGRAPESSQEVAQWIYNKKNKKEEVLK